jgi:hypothetical protein
MGRSATARLLSKQIPLRALGISLRAQLARDRLHECGLPVGESLRHALGLDPPRIGAPALGKLTLGAGSFLIVRDLPAVRRFCGEA